MFCNLLLKKKESKVVLTIRGRTFSGYLPVIIFFCRVPMPREIRALTQFHKQQQSSIRDHLHRPDHEKSIVDMGISLHS